MATHLSQIIAVEKDTKDKAIAKLNHARGILSNRGLLSGLSRTYTPYEDVGEKLPDESTRVQYTVKGVLNDVQGQLIDLFDIEATKEYANCAAKADIVVDGSVLIKDAPATYILFLEKQLAELLSFVKSIPTLDTSEEWEFDSNQGYYKTEAVFTNRSKKDKKSKVVFEGNQHHPPQFLVWDEDVPVGKWKTVKFSGMLPAPELAALIARVERLQKAVKFAREEANRHEVKQQHVADAVLHYLFA